MTAHTSCGTIAALIHVGNKRCVAEFRVIDTEVYRNEGSVVLRSQLYRAVVVASVGASNHLLAGAPAAGLDILMQKFSLPIDWLRSVFFKTFSMMRFSPAVTCPRKIATAAGLRCDHLSRSNRNADAA